MPLPYLRIARSLWAMEGPNGSGKSSLFRVLGGLWPLVSGHIVKPGVGSDLNKEIFYVPQRPYTAVGTLRDQLIYPLTADQEVEPLTDSRMVELLKNVDLEYLLDRYPPEKEVNWGDDLSLGEQQRLGMARLFYHKPKFAILDECTSAVTTDMEERFCANVLAMGTSCITISHRPALVAFHDVILSLDGEGGWSVNHRREDSSTELGNDTMKALETKRQSDAKAVQRAFAMNKKDSAFSNSKAQSDISEVIIASSPSMKRNISPSAVPQLHGNTRALPMRVAAMCKVLMVESRFRELLTHSEYLLKKKWLFGILDDFITKQLPHNVTWGLSLIYAMEHKGDRASVTTQGDLAHALRFLASVVSQSFLAFGDILELNRKFVELSGGINRIFELEELLDAAQSENFTSVSAIPPMRDVHSSDVISFSKVDIITPAQKMLVRELICDIKRGGSLLVTGPNGSGKSSIFRVLRGLWPIASGRLSRPSEVVDEEDGSGCGIFYVPQRPYTCLGTLRDQIIYPLSREEAEVKALKMYGKGEKHADTRNLLDTRLKVILEIVRLNYLLEREGSNWDANFKWEDILSLGEQQRLGMARLFFHKPKFGILDECTNATSVDVEEHLYGLAKDMGITVVTSSQRPALIPFHSMELRLIDGEGNWKLRLIEQ